MSKPSNQKPYGLLNPLGIPSYPWESVGIDFVGPLPESCNQDGQFDSLMSLVKSRLQISRFYSFWQWTVMLPNGFILTVFSFYFFYLLFYLGHGHVAGLGNLTSSLSARARVYGNMRLRSLLVDSGSDRTCLTLEWHTVTWQDGCGHADEHSAILRTRLSSLSAVFWWGVIGTTNKTIRGARVWIRPGVSSVRSYLRACLRPSHRNRPSTVYLVCGRGKEIFTCKRPGSS